VGPLPDPGQPGASAGEKQPSTMATLARTCPTRLAVVPGAQGERLPLTVKPDVPKLIQEGREGRPQEIRLRLHHPADACECPRFAITDYDADVASSVGGLVQVVFPSPLPEAHRYHFSGRYGHTVYDMMGYFSGREIDTYEWHKLQYGTDAPAPNEEQRSTWSEKYPEFCVESYCVVPDLVRDHVESFYRAPEFLTKYKKELQRMRTDGVIFCQKE
jgi:hypothetical protein